MRWLWDLKGHSRAFRELLTLMTKHRALTMEMAKRELTDKYLGQVLGSFWIIGHPLVLMAVYVFIFAYVFKMKVGGTRELPLDYTTYLLSGLIPWIIFQETMSKAGTVIVANANLVKQVIFPIEILPLKGVLASLVTMFTLLAVLVGYVLITHHFLLWSYLLLPVLIVFQTLAMVGVSYILASVGVFFRDVKDFIQIFGMVGMYLMPVFYLPAQVPGIFKPVLYANPFSYLAWCFQDVLYYGRLEHWWAWIIFPLWSLAVFYAGFRVFKKLKVLFGNVL